MGRTNKNDEKTPLISGTTPATNETFHTEAQVSFSGITLPDDLVETIFNNLDPHDAVALALSSRALLAMAKNIQPIDVPGVLRFPLPLKFYLRRIRAFTHTYKTLDQKRALLATEKKPSAPGKPIENRYPQEMDEATVNKNFDAYFQRWYTRLLLDTANNNIPSVFKWLLTGTEKLWFMSSEDYQEGAYEIFPKQVLIPGDITLETIFNHLIQNVFNARRQEASEGYGKMIRAFLKKNDLPSDFWKNTSELAKRGKENSKKRKEELPITGKETLSSYGECIGACLGGPCILPLLGILGAALFPFAFAVSIINQVRSIVRSQQSPPPLVDGSAYDFLEGRAAILTVDQALQGAIAIKNSGGQMRLAKEIELDDLGAQILACFHGCFKLAAFNIAFLEVFLTRIVEVFEYLSYRFDKFTETSGVSDLLAGFWFQKKEMPHHAASYFHQSAQHRMPKSSVVRALAERKALETQKDYRGARCTEDSPFIYEPPRMSSSNSSDISYYGP